MAKKRARPSKPTTPTVPRGWLWAGLLVVTVVGLGLATYFAAPRLPPPAPPGRFPQGPVSLCNSLPPFARALGYDESAVLDTQAGENRKGLVLYSRPASPEQQPTDVYQHPSWTSAGFLGQTATDKFGNIYAAPAPRISLFDNPPEKQNTLYKVDANTGVMAEFLPLPWAAAPSPESPYGLLGLAYDCDTHNLYASSVAGSTRLNEVGRIFHIDLNTGRVASQLEATDAFGLAVFNGVSGKRLYFGSARQSEIRSVALAEDGRFAGVSRLEVSLAGWGAAGDDKARRLDFTVRNTLIVRGVEFTFSLIARSDRPQTTYTLNYDPNTDTWRLAP
jgi:hypothetical protein